MAKKVRKAKMSLWTLFFTLLVPWVVMGGVAAGAFLAGLPDYAAILIGLAASLAVTFYIRTHLPAKRRAGQ